MLESGTGFDGRGTNIGKIESMNDSMAHPGSAIAPLELPGWKATINWLSAILVSLLFLVSGLWKVTDPAGAAVRMAQARIPENLSLAAALLFGIAETTTAVLLLVPRFRRWGAWAGTLLLMAFMIYVGFHYNALRGAECNCFPWIKRAVGPMFFLGDAVMMLLAVMAGVWARPSENRRSAVLILAAVSVFAFASYGMAEVRQSGTKAPDAITVDGAPYSLREGRVLIFFFDPECMHCVDAARRMSKLNCGDTRVVGVATAQPQFAPEFLRTTGLKGGISTDLTVLKKIFPFGDPPAAVALENGREKEALTRFEGEEPAASLKKLGFIY
jgi:uncharacterized membrane protein YphA (DoxX/SURF4 family)